MSEGFVSKRLFDRVMKMTRTSTQVRESLERMSALEPHLYARLFQEIATLKEELEGSTIPTYVIDLIDYRFGRALGRLYLSLTIATRELWADVESMNSALLKRDSASGEKGDKKDPPDAHPQRPDSEPWL